MNFKLFRPFRTFQTISNTEQQTLTFFFPLFGRKAQVDLTEAYERADLTEQACAKYRSRGRSQSMARDFQTASGPWSGTSRRFQFMDRSLQTALSQRIGTSRHILIRGQGPLESSQSVGGASKQSPVHGGRFLESSQSMDKDFCNPPNLWVKGSQTTLVHESNNGQ